MQLRLSGNTIFYVTVFPFSSFFFVSLDKQYNSVQFAPMLFSGMVINCIIGILIGKSS